ncbi:ribosomal protein L21 [Nesidiocoris tenuis]|uniref:Large ribosomal subunit protein bL21m n=1 Tax=Nesidiocoris tenuis TaxID=355587 RepID=A0ABN7BCK4_9HEMI|nr:ribosomal protein L21 [Nesidiocoris tenuis]
MLAGLMRNVLQRRTAFLPTLTKCLPASQPTSRLSQSSHIALQQEVLPTDDEIRHVTSSTIQKVNDLVAQGNEGRLFAVIHVAGKQFKVTAEDLILIEGYWPPSNGDEINMEKVMLVGGVDFTLVGRPLLPPGLVRVKATVIEKSLSHTKPVFYKKPRKQYRRLNFYRAHLTMLRINEITITGDINNPPSVVQVERPPL